MLYIDDCSTCKHKRPLKDGWDFCCDAFPNGMAPRDFPFGKVKELKECNNGIGYESSEYRDFFNERFVKKKSIRKYAAEYNLNRGSVNHIQKKFYIAFAEQLAIRDKAQNKCCLKRPTE